MIFLANCENLGPILGVVKNVYDIILIAVPIILLVIGSVDLAKAVMAVDEKEMKSATSLLGKRLMVAAVVFIFGNIVNLVLGFVGGGLECWGSSGNGGNNNSSNFQFVSCPGSIGSATTSTAVVVTNKDVTTWGVTTGYSLEKLNSTSAKINKSSSSTTATLVTVTAKSSDGTTITCNIKVSK